ncbi:hypothetical protein BV900_23965 [Agrobacterium tumefaciens]|nr:hypothetical protein BV900_23965 [Agrobacterium tumefaciens]
MLRQESFYLVYGKAVHGATTVIQPIAKMKDDGRILAPAPDIIIKPLTMIMDHPGQRREDVSGVFGSKTEV